MEQIFEPNSQFQFDKLVLTNPIFVNSGNYFIKYLMNDSPLYIQPPKCATKQGFIKGGKKLFCDLLFTNENESFIRWIEDLENYSQKYIFNNREKWFETDLEMHDIESSFTSPLKLYKSGKFYIVRTIIPTRLGKCTLRIFDEQEMDVPMESIQDGTVVMTIWEIQGIKCSTRNFQIDIEVKQMMVIPKSNLFDRCVISKNSELSKETFSSLATTHSVPNSSGDLRSPSELVEQRLLGTEAPLPELFTTDLMQGNNQEQNTTELLNSEVGKGLPYLVASSLLTQKVASLPEEFAIRTDKLDKEDLTPSELVEQPPLPKMDESGKGHTERVASSLLTSKVALLEHEPEKFAEKDTILDESDNDDEYDYDNGFTIDIDEMESDENIPITNNDETSSGVEVVDFNPEDIQEPNDFQLKTRNDVYYEIYTNAKKKAEEARNLAISAYLEAKRIKDLYLIHEPLDIFTGGQQTEAI